MTYHVGDSINLRIRVQNLSGEHVTLFRHSPWEAVDVNITDDSGHALPRKGLRDPLGFRGISSISVNPGATTVLDWRGNPWLELGHWGYHLTKPGTYTLEAIPQMYGTFLSAGGDPENSSEIGHIVPDAKAFPSNAVVIHISQ